MYCENNNLSVSHGDLAPDEKQLQGVEQSIQNHKIQDNILTKRQYFPYKIKRVFLSSFLLSVVGFRRGGFVLHSVMITPDVYWCPG